MALALDTVTAKSLWGWSSMHRWALTRGAGRREKEQKPKPLFTVAEHHVTWFTPMPYSLLGAIYMHIPVTSKQALGQWRISLDNSLQITQKRISIITLLIISVTHSIFNLLMAICLFYLSGIQNYQEGDTWSPVHRPLPTKFSVFFFCVYSSNFSLVQQYNFG